MAVEPVSIPRVGMDPVSEEMRGRFFGMYLAYVVDRMEPTQEGRVRLWCPSVLSGEKTEKNCWLPWANPSANGLDVPELGAAVWVAFEGGYPSHPVYFPGIIIDGETPKAGTGGEDWPLEVSYTSGGSGPPITATLPADTARDNPPAYPKNHVFERFGWRFELTEGDDGGGPRGLVRHPSGTTLLIDAQGRVQVRSEGGIFFDTVGDFVIGLREGASFKVVREGGTSMILGASGFHVTGHSSSILGRTVIKGGRGDI